VRYRFVLVAAALCAVSVSCRSKEAPAPAASATLAETPAPASLLAELSLGNPKQTWQSVRLLGGDAAQSLPSSLPVLLATSLSFPPAAAGSLDESLPMVGAVLARDDAAEPDVVLGMHVVSGAELVASLTLGDGAKFRKVELAPRVQRLVAAPGAAEWSGALGVSGNYLLVATRAEALTAAGRFVADSVSKRARKDPGLELRANERLLKERVARLLRAAWQMRRAALVDGMTKEREAKGRAPDFAEPEALLAGVDNTIESFLDVVESSRELVLSVTPDTPGLRVELALTPGTDGASSLLAREMVTGSLLPLQGMPGSTDAALMLRGDDARPASGLSPLIAQLFGARLNSEQGAKLSSSIEAFQRTRRGATTIGIVTNPAPALLLRFELAEPKAFSGAVADVLRLVELGPVRSWLGGTLGTPALELGQVGAAAGRARLRFRRPSPASSSPASVSVSWEAEGAIGSVVVAADDKVGLSPLRSADKLSGDPWQAEGSKLGQASALALYLNTALLAPGGPDHAPLWVVLGKRGDQIVLEARISPSALGALRGFLR
jgi:hypothetical protein